MGFRGIFALGKDSSRPYEVGDWDNASLRQDGDMT